MSVPKWSDPPPIGGPTDPRAKWVEVLRPLMLEPMRWAVIASGTPSSVNQLANALRTRQWNIPPGEWEFTVRTFRRGHHVGDMNVCQLYARFRGGQTDQTWSPEGWHGLTYKIRDGVVFDEWGYRVCPDCGDRLTLHAHGGSWPTKCDACWDRIEQTGTDNQRKWARRRRALRSGEKQYPKRDRTPMCIAIDCRADGTVPWSGFWLCDEHAEQIPGDDEFRGEEEEVEHD